MSEKPILFSGPTRERLLSKTSVVASGCWEWTAARNAKGYGRFGNTLAHRAAYLLLVGQIEPGHTVDHLCRNRACVNPEHLEAVPHAINIRRGVAARDTGTCPNGHGVAHRAERPSGRTCLACDRERNKRAYVRTSSRRARGWLTLAEHARIKEMIAAGAAHSRIAAALGISVATVSRSRHRAD